MDAAASNLLHNSSERAHWSRANEKGVFPGVATFLNWSIWGEIGERSVRLGAFDLGLLGPAELEPPAAADDWMWSIFYGRPAANVDSWSRLYERGLAGDGAADATRRQVFGSADAAASGERAELHLGPDAAARRERTVARVPAELRRLRQEVEAWWRSAVVAAQDGDASRRVLRQGLSWFARCDRRHIAVSLLATRAVAALAAAAEAAGRAQDANALMVGYPGMEEFRTTVALWDVSRGRSDLPAFLGEHGFHGPQEGEIASRSWREDPAPVAALVERFRALPDGDDPRAKEAAATAER